MSSTIHTAYYGSLLDLLNLLQGEQLRPHELQAALCNLAQQVKNLSTAHVAHLSAHLQAGTADAVLPHPDAPAPYEMLLYLCNLQGEPARVPIRRYAAGSRLVNVIDQAEASGYLDFIVRRADNLATIFERKRP
jgi:hypothetical protein